MMLSELIQTMTALAGIAVILLGSSWLKQFLKTKI